MVLNYLSKDDTWSLDNTATAWRDAQETTKPGDSRDAVRDHM